MEEPVKITYKDKTVEVDRDLLVALLFINPMMRDSWVKLNRNIRAKDAYDTIHRANIDRGFETIDNMSRQLREVLGNG